MGLPVVRTGDAALDRFLDAVRQYIDRNPSGGTAASSGGVRRVQALEVQPTVESAVKTAIRNMPPDEIEAFAKSISRTRLFASLTGQGSALNGVVDGLPRTMLADINAAKRGSTAAVTSAAIVSADDGRAVSALVTEVTARLNAVNVGSDSTGQPVTATVEEAFLALVDKLTGAEAQYTVKLTTGGAIAGVAGFGLSLTSPVGAAPSSAFIVAADKFAVVSPSYSGGLTDSPNTAHVPFGVDASGVYINGQVRINAGGVKVEDGIHGPTKAVCFLRAATAPLTPAGGSYANPTATGWSDGVPAGTLPLYMSTRIFTKDGLTPQQAVWTTPQLVSSLGQGAKVQFSVDGLTGWHDTPDTEDVYMRSGVSTDGGDTWTYAGAAKIKGENGATRNVRNITGSTWSDSEAITAIQAAGHQAPVVRDEVTLVNNSAVPPYVETRYWSGFAWVASGVSIDGNLLVSGTITADKIGAGIISSATINTSSYILGRGDYTSGSYTFNGDFIKSAALFETTGGEFGYPWNFLAGVVGVVPSGNHNAWGKFGMVGLHNIGSNEAAAQGGLPLSGGVAGVTDKGTGVYGYATGAGTGVVAKSVSGAALNMQGKLIWGIYTWDAPDGSNKVLRADGTWGSGGSGDAVTLQTAGWDATVASSGVTVLTMMQTTTTLTIASTSSQYSEFTLVLKQGTGSNKVTWPGNVKHVPIRPATSTQVNWKDFFVLRTFDTGTTWYCFAQGGGVV